MRAPVETAELQAFAQTVDARSLSRAAAELGVPRATVSRRLARLEEQLGARLLRRTTRSLALTDAGEALYRHARIVLDAVRDAEASVRTSDDRMRGDLRVSVPPGIDSRFHALFCDFAVAHPAVRLQVHASTRHVDLVRDGYDVAIRAGAVIEPGLIARKLSADRALCVAAPAYLAAHGTPGSPRELARHRCLVAFTRGELPGTHWPLVRGGRLQVTAAMSSNDLPLLCEAALRGLGIALLPTSFVGGFLDDGSLVTVLAGAVEAPAQIAVVYPERELVPPQVRAFVDAVLRWAPIALPAIRARRAAGAAARRAAVGGRPSGGQPSQAKARSSRAGASSR